MESSCGPEEPPESYFGGVGVVRSGAQGLLPPSTGGREGNDQSDEWEAMEVETEEAKDIEANHAYECLQPY